MGAVGAAERVARARELFDRCLELDGPGRLALLARESGDDPGLRALVEALLAMDARSDLPLDHPLGSTVLAPPLAAGDRIGPYLIRGVLGAGGMGIVYRAEHGETGREVALKTIPAPDAATAASIRREVQALSVLSHPGIVRILDHGSDDGVPWYAMQLLPGRTLRQALGTGIPRTEALTIVRRLAETLACLHAEGMVHRDVKPENVVLGEDGSPVLVDFGLLQRFVGDASRESLASWLEAAGTVAYVAPEQAEGQLVDARADIYALGCILYEVLTGAPPHHGGGRTAVLRRRLAESVEPPSTRCPDVSEDLDALTHAMLVCEPRHRIGHADEVAARLADLGAEGLSVPVPRARHLYRAPLAGRDELLSELVGLATAEDADAARVLVLAGESGVGKTRLAMAVAHALRARGVLVLAGNCQPDPGTALPGFAPLFAAMVDIFRTGVPPSIAAPTKILSLYDSTLAAVPAVAALPPLPDVAPDRATLRLCQALATSVEAVAGEAQSVLLILDDLHAADEATAAFLRHVARTGRPRRGTILATCRSEERERWRDLVQGPRTRVVDVARLAEDAVAAIAGDMLAIPPPPPALAAFLARHTEGNPYFLAEYLRSAVDEGLIERDPRGAWRTRGDDPAAFDRLPIPPTVVDVVARRLDGLPVRARELVMVASLFGREAASHLWLRFSGTGEHDAQGCVQALLGRHVLEEPRPGRLRFAHDKLREVAATLVPADERGAFHGRIARALQEDGRDRHAAALGHHWEMAGEIERAVPCYLAAAQQARNRWDGAEAERLYRRYLALAGPPTTESINARNELGFHVLLRRGRTREAEAEHRRAFEDAAAIGDAAAELFTRQQLSTIYLCTGRNAEARGILDGVLALSLQVENGRLEPVILEALANVAFQEGDAASARELYERALSACRQRRAEPGREGHLLGNLGSALFVTGDHARAGACWEQALAIARETGNRHGEGIVLTNLGVLREGQGRDAEALGHHEQALAIAVEIGDRRTQTVALVHVARSHRGQRHAEEERVALEKALEIAREDGDRYHEGEVVSLLGAWHHERGDPGGAASLFREAIVILRETGNGRLEVETEIALGAALGDLGDVDEAATHLTAGAGLSRAQGDAAVEAFALVRLAALLLCRGGPESGVRDALDRALAVAAVSGVGIAEIACVRGHQELAHGRDATAELAEAQAAAPEGSAAARGAAGFIERLQRAIEDLGHGERLDGGYASADVAPGRLAWLGTIPPAADR